MPRMRIMKLIRIIERRKYKNNSTGLFLCPYCKSEVEKTLKNGERSNSCGCTRAGKTTLGTLCGREHDHEGTGKSLRYVKSGECVMCARMRREKHEKRSSRQEMSLKRKREKARQYASLHCIYYRDCRDKAAYSSRSMKCYQCEKFEKIENNYQKELGPEMFNRSVSRYPLNIEMQRS